MSPEILPIQTAAQPTEAVGNTGVKSKALTPDPGPKQAIDLDWALLGNHGLRSGWSILIFAALYRIFSLILGTVALSFFPDLARLDFSPEISLIGESVPLLALLAALAFVARIEHRSILEYNLTDARRVFHLLGGLGAGFVALSALVGAMAWGGWLHFGFVALSGAQILSFGALWGAVFLAVALFEEGSFRCYLQSTLARGIHFWWALGIVAVLCLDLLLRAKGMSIVSLLWLDSVPRASGNGSWGVFGFALLGLIPCLLLHIRKTPGNGFWQAAWVTSTLFGFIHTGNNGENWIGIFAASAIGFVFCVSIRLTGSAWWAIGCHAAWDWAETFFYGTADSGYVATGHYLTTNPAGNTLWSGGSDGPEGSLLVLAIILLLLTSLVAIYGRRKTSARDHSARAIY